VNGSDLQLTEETDYPWNGDIKITINQAPAKEFSLFLRIPGWAGKGRISVNGKLISPSIVSGYAEIKRKWMKGDRVELMLPLEAKLMEANPLVEENRNQVAVKRGPVVYCLESVDMPSNRSVFQVSIPAGSKFNAKMITVDGAPMMSLSTNAKSIENNWDGKLYKEVSTTNATIPVKLVPYYAWGNRGHSEMTVWLPVSR
jgi:DUF1680 family protein